MKDLPTKIQGYPDELDASSVVFSLRRKDERSPTTVETSAILTLHED